MFLDVFSDNNVTIVTNDNYSKLKYRKDGKVVKPDKSNA